MCYIIFIESTFNVLVGVKVRPCYVLFISMLVVYSLQLTLIELEFLKLITTHELAVYTWECNDSGNTHTHTLSHTHTHTHCA